MDWVPADLALAASAAVVAALIAWLLVRSSSEDRPGWAVRIYAGLFRTSQVPGLEASVRGRRRFPRREAFLATWFIIFFVLFMGGTVLSGAK
jgi:hypothetical protein